MKIAPLIGIRNRIKGYTPLLDYLTEKYGKTGRYVIGAKKPNNIETDYPYFSVFSTGEVRDFKTMTRNKIVVVMWYIHQPDTLEDDPDVYKGVLEHSEIGELLLDALFEKSHLSYSIQQQVTVLSDFKITHPFYSGGMQLSVYSK